jgi:RNA polymerase sigma factor (sigma-70 family)
VGVVSLPRILAPLEVRSLDRLGDERLAALVHRGDDEAFSVLYDRYRTPIARYCRSIVREPEDAVDAQQNAMLSALRALRKRRLTGRVRPWLYRIAHNESISVLRRRRESVVLDDQLPAPVRHEEVLERWQVLLGDLRSLPERQRGALVMRELGGLEYDEIAMALSVKPASARKAVFEARVALGETASGRLANCDDIRRRISDGDGRVLRARRVRGHLEECTACTAFELGLRERRGMLELIPVPLVGLAGGLGVSGLAGSAVGGVGHGGVGGFGVGGSAVGGAAALGGGSLAVKGIAACAVCFVAGAGVILDGGLQRHAGARPAGHHAERHVSAARHAPAAVPARSSAVKLAGAHLGASASRAAPRTSVRHASVVPVSGTGTRAPARLRVLPGGRPQAHAVPRLTTHAAVPAPGTAVVPVAPVAATTATPTAATPTAVAAGSPPSSSTTAVQTATATPTSLAQVALKAIDDGWALAAQAAQTALGTSQQTGSSASGSTSSVQGLLTKILSGGR